MTMTMTFYIGRDEKVSKKDVDGRQRAERFSTGWLHTHTHTRFHHALYIFIILLIPFLPIFDLKKLHYFYSSVYTLKKYWCSRIKSHFWKKIITLTHTIYRGVWNLKHTFHLYLIIILFFTLGPMVAAVNSKITLVGVTSFGTGCAQSPYPGVYSRVSAQKAWILANSDAGSCQN